MQSFEERVFFDEADAYVAHSKLAVTGFKIGALPVKYLGCSVNYEKAGLYRLQTFTGQNIFKTSEMGKKYSFFCWKITVNIICHLRHSELSVLLSG